MPTNKPFGIRGDISPSIKDIDNDFVYDDRISISVYDGVFEVGYDTEEDKNRALKIAVILINGWSFRNFKICVDFNQSWKPDSHGNKTIGISVHDSLSVKDRVIITTTTKRDMSYVVKQKYDSYHFSNDLDITKKAEKDETLSLVLDYFHDEVLGAERPNVGVYRIVEEIFKKVGGKRQLAQLVGQNQKYIDEITESVQDHRHALAWLILKKAKPIINEHECVERAKKLIRAYADSLQMI